MSAFITSPIDDTFQLDEMATEADLENFANFGGSTDDKAPIVVDSVEDEGSGPVVNNRQDDVTVIKVHSGFSCRGFISVFMLTAINLMNYMDRFTIAGKFAIFLQDHLIMTDDLLIKYPPLFISYIDIMTCIAFICSVNALNRKLFIWSMQAFETDDSY